MLKLTFITLFGVVALHAAPTIVDVGLRQTLKSQPTVNILITFKAGTASVLNLISSKGFNTREDRLNTLTSELKLNAAKSQKHVLDFLASQQQFAYESFWITNQIYIESADLSLIERLATFDQVFEISEAEAFEIDEPIDFQKVSRTDEPRLEEWGIRKIQASEAWALNGGNRGQHVRVATIDTGVRVTHEALRNNFLGLYGWFEPYLLTAEPNDAVGHGTHTMGTIAGQGGIGVAPDAKWMSCKGCPTSACQIPALLSCGQFMLAPTLFDGSSPNSSYAPHLVSNSWGGGRGITNFHGVIDAWNAAGIITIFSNGNSGPGCKTANSPADHPNVIAVGSTTMDDELSPFSSLGPSYPDNLIRPDVTSPGSTVVSAYNSGDTDYVSLSGSSMAGPHTGGIVALLKSRNVSLGLAEIKNLLNNGAEKNTLVKPGKNCGGIDESVFPNHSFGHGRVNAYESLKLLMNAGNI